MRVLVPDGGSPKHRWAKITHVTVSDFTANRRIFTVDDIRSVDIRDDQTAWCLLGPAWAKNPQMVLAHAKGGGFEVRASGHTWTGHTPGWACASFLTDKKGNKV